VQRDKPRKLKSVGQTLPQLPWKQKRGFKKNLDSVSSISVRRVTCYDHFCLFKFFGILAASMATAAIF
jgi:hypothetical protein